MTRELNAGVCRCRGDPLHPENVPYILKLVKRVREECAGKDIWVWTGYTLAELDDAQREVTKYIDVLIDGKFEQDKKI